MAIPTITKVNVGVSYNDGSGDVLRDAFVKVNNAFDAIAAYVNTLALDSAVTAEATARAAADTTIQAEVDLKQDSATDAASSCPNFSGAQAIDNTQRRQLGVNTGQPVTLQFPLFDALTNPTSATFDLPFLPDAFTISDMFVTLNKRTVGSGGVWQMSYSLTNNGTVVGGQLTTSIDATGTLGSTIVIAGRLLAAFKANQLTLTITDSETGSPVHKGLTLWLRGAWAQP